MRRLTLFLITFMACSYAIAQDFPYGEVDNKALEMKKYDKDTSAHAVMLQEYGTSRIAITNDYHVRLIFEYHAKIKFFDSKEFENAGTILIPIYTGDDLVFDEVYEIKGVTYYKDDKGLVQKAELDPKKVFTVKEDKHYSTVKFAMPSLKSGCVIEISYKLMSPYYYYNFRSWQFQSSIPKMYSEYEVHIPGVYNYNASLRGSLKLSKNKATIENKCFTFGTSSSDCSDIIYGMNDIPALIEEDHMTSVKNFLSAVNFQLVESTDLQSGSKSKVSQDWRTLDQTLKSAEYFGTQLKKTSLLKDRILPIIVNKTDSLEKAKAVYAYIQKTIKWNNQNDFGSEGIRKALDDHTGNSADINLALVTALNAAGIPAEAVLLSTRTHGALNNLYPNVDDFNYVIAKVNIANKSYLLDATDPLLPFGILPLRCLNDKGRVFSLNKPSYWIDMVTPQKETSTYMFDLTLQENGKLKGTMTHYSIGYAAYLKRKEIKKFNTLDEYIENLSGESSRLKILKSDIANVDSLEQSVTEKYEVEIDVIDKKNPNREAFDPFFYDKLTSNPFKLTERSYPVDWGMPSDSRYILTIHMPAGYTIETPPQNVAFSMPNHGGKFMTDFSVNDNTFTFSRVTQLSKSVYDTAEYPYLKELFNKIILSEKTDMVFKKKI